jgi:hypothetical protein
LERGEGRGGEEKDGPGREGKEKISLVLSVKQHICSWTV